MKTQYYRLVTYLSRDLNPIKTKDLLYFDSYDYETDKKQARKYRPGYRVLYVSKKKYDTFGDALKNCKQ